MVANITGFNQRNDGYIVTASVWNNELGGIYTYINNTLVQALNTLTTKGDILAHDGSTLVRMPVGATNGHTLQVDSTQTNGMRWAPPGGLPLSTKGDLLVNDGSTNVRLPIGANGTVLTADSAAASGVKWAAVGNIFQSTDLTITPGALYAAPHGFSSIPRNAWYALVCQVAELGYSVGDVVFTYVDNDSPSKGLSMIVDATHVKAQISGHANVIFIIMSRLTATAAAITFNRWKLRLFAQL